MAFVHGVWHPGTRGPHPTLVVLHGHGAHGQDLLGIAPYLAAGRLLVIGPEGEFALEAGAVSFTWFHRDGDQPRAAEEFERVAARLQAFIADAAPRYGGDPERVALLGFSQGGTLAYRLGLGEPRRYRGVAALSTTLPEEAVAHADLEGLAALSVLVQHGTEDQMIAIERAREACTNLRALGVSPQYLEYPMPHAIGMESLRDLSRWLEQIFELPAVE